MSLTLRNYTRSIIYPHPAILELKEYFRSSDPSVFPKEGSLEDSYIQKVTHLNTNGIKLFNTIQQKYPDQMNELIFISFYIAPISSFYFTHQVFYPVIKLLGTEEQAAKWTQLLVDGRIFGSYAQTEIGHGSDVQSLMTSATYNKEKKTFVLNSPSTKSVKYWPGCLGWQATHVVCQAQTYIDGKHYGLQTFVASIRDSTTFKVLEGVEVGDIGPKLGYSAGDNDYLKFTNYEIPRENLLMKFIKVSEDGTVQINGGKTAVKLGYGGMLGLRVNLSLQFLMLGFRSIALFYRSAIKSGETSMLVHRRLMDEITYLYSNILAIQSTKELHSSFNNHVKTNLEKALSELNELHLLASGFKAYNSWRLVEQARQTTVRQPLGNLMTSESIFIYGEFVPSVTYEGDNLVMLQQTARGLCKFMQLIEAQQFDKIPSSFRYLVKFRELLEKKQEIKFSFNDPKQLLDPEMLENLIGSISLFSLEEAYAKMKEKAIQKIPSTKSWNEQLQSVMIKMAVTVMRGITYLTPKTFLSEGGVQQNLQGDDVKLLKEVLIYNGLNILKTEVNKMCQFKIGAPADKINELIIQAQDIVMKQLDEKFEYLIESNPSFEEELLYVRDYKNWNSSLLSPENLKGNLNNTINNLSKL